jgi:hypothetical protein
MCKVTPLPSSAATRSVLGQRSGEKQASSSKASSPSSPTSFLSLGYAVIADFLNSNSEQAAVEKSRSSVPAPPPRKDGKLTMEHVAAHHRDGDAWVAIKGKVRYIEEIDSFFRTERALFAFLCRCWGMRNVEESTPISQREGEDEMTREEKEGNRSRQKGSKQTKKNPSRWPPLLPLFLSQPRLNLFFFVNSPT